VNERENWPSCVENGKREKWRENMITWLIFVVRVRRKGEAKSL